MTRLAAATPMTFIATADRDRAKAFYRDTLGLALTHEDEFACVFDLNGISLRVSTTPGFAPQSHTVLGWQVDDIAATVQALREAGVAFTIYDGFGQDELGIWSPPGGATKVAWFTDPDRNVLSVAQLG